MMGAYLFCAVLGLSFMGLSALMGHLGAHGHAGTLGHHGVQGVELPYFSPAAIAAYLTGFGASGLVLTQGFHLHNPLIHVPLSLLFAGGFGVGMLYGTAKLTQAAETNTLPSLSDVVGTRVEVTIAIPAGGTGEVAYVSGGTRQSGMAEADAGQAFPQGATVRVTAAVDGVLHVTAAPALATAAAVATLGEPLDVPPDNSRNKIR